MGIHARAKEALDGAHNSDHADPRYADSYDPRIGAGAIYLYNFLSERLVMIRTHHSGVCYAAFGEKIP